MRFVLLLLALAVPLASAGPTTLFAHVDGAQDFQLSTLAPPDGHAANVEGGLLDASTSCAPEVEQAGLLSRDMHRWYGVVSTTAIDYAQGSTHMHTERGLAHDLRLNASAPAVFHWYLAASQRLAAGPAAPVDMVVEVTIRLGDAISVGHAAFDTGDIVATGQSDPVLTAPGEAGHAVVGGRDVYHFEVPLDIRMDTVSVNESFNVRVDARMDEPVCQDGKAAPFYAVHSSTDHRPRLEWSVQEALYVQEMQPQFVGDELYLRARLQSAFGAYDVGEATARLTGPAGDVEVSPLARISDYHGHTKPVPGDVLTWVGVVGGEPGEYAWHIEAWNLQATDHAEAALIASLPADKASPGLLAPLLLGLLVMVWRQRLS